MKKLISKMSNIAGVCLVGIISCNPKQDIQPRPNIILCMADDQGWGDVGYYGHPKIQTPNLDDMAASGLRFDHFYAAAPVCSPTRGSVLTGRTPNRFGCFCWGYPIRPQELTIAEVLKQAGYATGHFGKWHLGSIQKGSPINPEACGFDEWLSSPNFYENNPILSKEGTAVQLHGESSIVTIDAAIDFIGRHVDSNKPTFTVVWFGSPHLPHIASQEDSALYAGLPSELRNYYGEITGIDRAMGKLRKALNDLGVADNTLVWYCSDNGGKGEGVSVFGGRGHKGDIYEGGLRVPGIIEWPAKINKSRISKIPSFTCDIYPTLLEVTGISTDNQPVLDGISLMPVIENRMNSRPQPIGFWKYTNNGRYVPNQKWMEGFLKMQEEGTIIIDSTELHMDAGKIDMLYPDTTFPEHAAWLDWPYKLHRIEAGAGKINIELYNLEKDSMEQVDLSGMDIQKVNTMQNQLEGWLSSVVQSLNGMDYH